VLLKVWGKKFEFVAKGEAQFGYFNGMKRSVIITCEHAGNEVPPEYQHLFAGNDDVLASHRGWDPGAHAIAARLAEKLDVPFFFCNTSRLIIETNRSVDHPQLFSAFTQSLPEQEKQKLLKSIYMPYRTNVEECIRSILKPVLHLSIHTFTPVLGGVPRDVDIGLLFDPARTQEKKVCEVLQKSLVATLPAWKIKLNEPYLGIDDGFTTYLRTKFSDDAYAGVEVEVTQRYGEKNELESVASVLLDFLKLVLSNPLHHNHLRN